MPSFSHLPQETLDLIIDICADSSSYSTVQENMKSCSLVCHALRTRAQSKVFRAIVIRGSTEASELYEIVATNPQLATHVKVINLSIGSLTHEKYFVESKAASLLALLNALSPTTTITLHIHREDGEDEDTTVPRIRKIAPLPAIFSRLGYLTLTLIQHIPAEIFEALPPLGQLGLNNVTFYPELQTYSDADLEDMISIPFSKIEVLTFEDMSYVPGIMIACCPILFELSLLCVAELSDLANSDDRLRPAPATIEVVFENYEGLLDTLTNSIIDLSKLHYLIEKTGGMMDREDFTVADAMAAHEELQCILSKCNSPTSQLGAISLDFYNYAYPTMIPEVGIDFSKLPTLTYVTMQFYCLEPDDDTNVLLHIRDILRTRPRGGLLVNMVIILAIPFPELDVREDGTSVIDADELPAVLYSPIWNDIKEEWRKFALDANESYIPATDGWNVDIKFVPIRVDDTPRMYTELDIRHEDSILRKLVYFCKALFPAVRSKAKFTVSMECADGEEYDATYSFRETDDGGEMVCDGYAQILFYTESD